MKTWTQLFIRHGWLLEEVDCERFDCSLENEENINFLMECLARANVSYMIEKDILMIYSNPVPEDTWLKAVDEHYRGITEIIFEPIHLPIKYLDTFISGVVRQLNRLGFHTLSSCDGHGRRQPNIEIKKDVEIDLLSRLFQILGFKRVLIREQRNSYSIRIPSSRPELLELAEKLSYIHVDWLEKGTDYIKEQLFYKLLEDTLNIPGKSGNEGEIREFVIEKLKPYVTHLTVDHAGNILAEKTYGTGRGPTILLNAHLDTVYEIEKDRSIIKKGQVWTSDKGILGADDRAGVSIILHLAEQLYQSQSFNGKIKYIFSVEEECGLIGASQVEEYFLWGTDAAIVVDRRGFGDIVISCGSSTPFCDIRYGKFFETVATSIEFKNWKITKGGSSDTRIWAEHGIQSVNLSVGYQFEHTNDEILDVYACYQTCKLVESALSNWRELHEVLRVIKREQTLVS